MLEKLTPKNIKHKLTALIKQYVWKAKNWVNYKKDPLVRSQLNHPYSIPIIIISYNQLYYLQQLVEFLLNRGFSNVIIVDNYSSYPPLLSYFDSIEKHKNITIHRLKENKGHLVFWNDTTLFEKYAKGFYVVTDADIVPFKNTPEHFMQYFLKLLNHYHQVTKVGFSLYLEDLPKTNPNCSNIKNWEQQFWKHKIKKNFLASIDTTFALYRPNYKREESNFLHAIRTNLPYTARHGGWYIDPKNLSDEQKYYIRTANSSSSWLTNENGELINKEIKSHYDKKINPGIKND